MDETLLQYTELFAQPERPGRRMRWEFIKEEEDLSPGGELVGKWSGERSVLVTLKRDVGLIPTWHFVGGGRIRVHVPGKRNCPRCLKPVGECRGGGEWSKCEASKVQKGDWKEEQEKFLEGLGWTDKKQKMMEELERKEAEGFETEEDDAENRAAEEQAEKETEEKEGLVQVLEEGKQCGAILLRNFPETSGDKKQEKQEVLLTVIVVCNLSEQEEKRLQDAEIVLTRAEKGKKKCLDVKISLSNANALLRKVWIKLERACKQENVKRYQIEASTPMTPVKEKPRTELRKARELVKAMMKQKLRKTVGEDIQKQAEYEGIQKNAEERDSFEPLAEGVQPGQMQHRGVELHGGLPGSQAAAVSASLQEGRETETIGCNRPGEGEQ